MLKVRNLSSGYGNVQIIWDASFEVRDGEVVAILGSNGAGKTTLVRTVTGMIHPKSGSIDFDGDELCGKPSRYILDKGIVQVPEGRQLFTEMTVYENLEMGAFSKEAKAKEREAKRKEREEYFTVKNVLSPNRILLSDGTVVRLIGVKEKPEVNGRATEYLLDKTKGHKVFLKFDAVKYDDDNVLLCYLYLKNRTFINAHLLKNGLVAMDYSIEFKYKSKFEKFLSGV